MPDGFEKRNNKAIYWIADDIRNADADAHCFAISERSRKLMLSLIEFVGWKTRYIGDVTDEEIDGWKSDLLYQLLTNEPCDPATEEENCVEYEASALFITYAPNDPFQTPEFIPPGYLLPPWYNNPLVPLPGVLPGDAMVNFLAVVPPIGEDLITWLSGLLASGLPRFRVAFSGTGTVEMEFVKIPQGGLILAVIDGDLLQVQVESLNALTVDLSIIEDIFDIVVEQSLDDTLIMEFPFETPGDHFIDVTFLPDFGLEPTILGFGGGLRSIELCGDLEMGEATMAQFQIDGCILQWRPNDASDWIDLVDLTECTVAGPPGEDGATLFIRDTGNGQLQTSPDESTWADVTNARYLHLNADNDPVTGALAVHPAADTLPMFVVRHAVTTPTQSLFEFQDNAGNVIFGLNYDKMLDFNGNSNRVRFDRGGFDLIFNRSTTNFITVDDGSGSATPTEVLALRNRATVALAIHRLGKVTVGNAVERNAAFYATNNVAANPVGVFRAAASQSGDMFQIRDSADAVISRVFASGAMEFGANDAANSAVSTAIFAYHHATGTISNGMGTSIRWLGTTSTTQKVPMGRIDTAWTDVTHASRKAQMALVAYDTDAREFLRGGANGSVPTIGVLGATPSARINMGAVHAAGNEAAYLMLLALEQFGFIEGTFTEGEPPEPGGGGSGGGIVVPDPLPLPSSLSADALCFCAKKLSEWFAHWCGWLVLTSSLETTEFEWLDVVSADNHSAFGDELSARSNFNADHLSDLVVARQWYLDHDAWAAGVVGGASPIIDFGGEAEFYNVVYCALTEMTAFDQTGLDALISAIAVIDNEIAVPLADSLSILPLGVWQRLYYVAQFGEDDTCDCDDWNVFMDFTEDDWSNSVDLIQGQYSGLYKTIITDDFVGISIPFHITSVDVSAYFPDSSGDGFQIVSIETGFELLQVNGEIGTEVYSWSGDEPEGITIYAKRTITNDTQIISVDLFGRGTQPEPD